MCYGANRDARGKTGGGARKRKTLKEAHIEQRVRERAMEDGEVRLAQAVSGIRPEAWVMRGRSVGLKHVSRDGEDDGEAGDQEPMMI